MSIRKDLYFADEWIKAFAEAIGVDETKCSRIVIDLRSGSEPARVYIEGFAWGDPIKLKPSDIRPVEIDG